MENTIFNPAFPGDALMGVMQGAVEYIHKCNQTPYEMCVASVMAASAICAQGAISIKWKTHGATSPNSYILVEAESSEGKSENDLTAFAALKEFSMEQEATHAIAMERHKEIDKIHLVKVKALEKLLQKLIISGRDTTEVEQKLLAVNKSKVKAPFCASLVQGDVTPEALSEHLHHTYPSVGVVSDDGFQKHMLADKGLLNSLFQGTLRPSKRISRQATNSKNVWVSLYVLIQPAILSETIEKHHTLYDSGFFNRCMLFKGKSTQGHRTKQFVDLPVEALEKYWEVQREILASYVGALPEPEQVELTAPAAALLKWFILALEPSRRDGGFFGEMKSAAGRGAEICIKICGIIYVMQKCKGQVSVEIVRSGIRITSWLLNQHRLRFHPLSKRELDKMAVKDVITRLLAHKGLSWELRSIQQIAPPHLRLADQLLPVLRDLDDDGDVHIFKVGRVWTVSLTGWGAPDTRQKVDLTALGSEAHWARPTGPAIRAAEERAERERAMKKQLEGHPLWPGVYLPDEASS